MTWDSESWKKAALDYHAARRERRTVLQVEFEPDRARQLRKLLADDVTLARAYAEINSIKGRAAASTIEALAYQLRGGVAALQEPAAQHRLAQLDQAQMREIAARLAKRVPPWSAADIEALTEMWSKRHG